MPAGHYENFPVASLLLPARLRPPVQALYRYARHADDLADEGNALPAERLAALDALARMLNAIEVGHTPPEWVDLAAAVRTHALPMQPLRDLLSAFAQDVTVHRYADDASLLDYCRRSADPVGRLLLALYRRTDATSLRMSDAICTGLQLTNFWQDVAIDWAKGRVYLPQDALARHRVNEAQIAEQRADAAWCALMRDRTDHARALLHCGAPLAQGLGGRIGLELRLVVHGGLRILERIDRAGGDVFRQRPTLAGTDWLLLALRALRPFPALR